MWSVHEGPGKNTVIHAKVSKTDAFLSNTFIPPLFPYQQLFTDSNYKCISAHKKMIILQNLQANKNMQVFLSMLSAL